MFVDAAWARKGTTDLGSVHVLECGSPVPIAFGTGDPTCRVVLLEE